LIRRLIVRSEPMLGAVSIGQDRRVQLLPKMGRRLVPRPCAVVAYSTSTREATPGKGRLDWLADHCLRPGWPGRDCQATAFGECRGERGRMDVLGGGVRIGFGAVAEPQRTEPGRHLRADRGALVSR
jgi:hypothetical protein